MWGYEGFLEAIADPEHEEHDEYLAWIGGDFDPEEFDSAGLEWHIEDQASANP